MTGNNRTGQPVARTGASYALALGLLALAGALAYFAFVLSAYRTDIPQILASIEQTSAKIEPVVAEVAEVRSSIPPILEEVAEVRKQIPAILAELAEIRQQIPPVLAEVGLVRQQIPAVLSEVAVTRKALPLVLKIVDTSTDTVVLVVDETAAIRQLIPKILTEVQVTRDSIPPTLDRVDGLISQARVAGREASSGAVTGIFKGIITAPFVIIGNAGQSVFGMSQAEADDFSEDDMAALTATSRDVLAVDAVGASKAWQSQNSDYSGEVTLLSIDTTGARECRELLVNIWDDDEEKFNKRITTCKNADGAWESLKK